MATSELTEIRNIKLPRVFRGYDTSAVDKLLEEVATSFETLSKERNELRERAQRLDGELGEHRDTQNLVREALVSAQRAADDLKERTRKECDALLAQARADAATIEGDAKTEHVRLLDEVERLKSQEQELRASYRVLLHAALDRLGEPTAEQATGVKTSLLDALAPRRLPADHAPNDTVEQPVQPG